MSAIEAILADVAAELDWLDPPPVFIGGATIGLFLDDFGRSQMRATKDVDCIVPSVTTSLAWFDLEGALRQRSWSPDPDGPICRYRSPRGHIVDLLAADPTVQGFAGTWFQAAVAHARPRSLGGTSVLVPDAAHVLACKVEAFGDRGAHDPLVSTDLEDIVALIDGCAEINERERSSDEELERFLAGWLTRIETDFASIAEAHLPRGGDDDGRRERLRATLHRLANL
jgi:hypothetical protein